LLVPLTHDTLPQSSLLGKPGALLTPPASGLLELEVARGEVVRSLDGDLEVRLSAAGRVALDHGVVLAVAVLVGDQKLAMCPGEGIGNQREGLVAAERKVRIDAAEIDLVAGLEAQERIAIGISG